MVVGRDDERVGDGAVVDQLAKPTEADEPNRDLLRRVEMGFALEGAIGRQICPTPVGEKRRIGFHHPQRNQVGAPVPGLLLELACGGSRRLLPRIDTTAGDLDGGAVGSMAVVAAERKRLSWVHRTSIDSPLTGSMERDRVN